MDIAAALGAKRVESHLVEARHRLGRELGSERHDQRVVLEVSSCGHDLSVVEVEHLGFRVAELNALPAQPCERPGELARAALADHLPQQRGLVHVLGCAIDQHDTVVCWKTTTEFTRGHQPAGAASEYDRAAGRPNGSASSRFRCGRALVHLLDGRGEPRLVEFVLGEDHLAVGTDEHAPRNPAVRQRTEQLPVAVGDHGELEPELLLPGAAGLLGLDRADVDDLEPVAREPLMESHDGRTLLPTALSGRFPEDQEDAVGAVDRQPEIGHRQGAPGLDASGQAVKDFHLLRSVLTTCYLPSNSLDGEPFTW